MEMTTHQLQYSCSTFPSVSSPWSRGCRGKHILPTFRPVGRKDRIVSLKCRPRSSVGASLVLGPKVKLCKISAFKGSHRDDDASGRANSPKSIKNTVKISFLQDESEESPLKSSKVQDVSSPCTTEDETATRSQTIQKLFKNWLMLLRTSPQTEPVEGGDMEESSSTESSEVPQTVQKQEKVELVKMVVCHFMNLDATIKVPLLIFTPMFVAVNIAYGSEVSKELTPLWILGPLVSALYVKMFKALCRSYAFFFNQTIKVITSLPTYCVLVHDYIFHGKLKQDMRKHLYQPFADIKNINYKAFAWEKLKELQEWLVDKYLDFVEKIWPFYCRTIRFLKRANLL